MSNTSIALQLYTIRDATVRDFPGMVREVAKIGYNGVEFAGYGGLAEKELAALLASTNLRAAGTHVKWDTLEDDPTHEIHYCVQIGCRNITIPFLGKEWFAADRLPALALRLNAIGRVAQEQGLTLSYHNHSHEFAKGDDGRYLLDALLDSTDPVLVKLELDTYWASFAGVDPIAYLHKRAGRVPLIHVKDMTPERTFTEVGAGTLDIRGICRAAAESGTEWYVVENDAPTIPSLESARRSFDNLSKILG
jgi:sugar phosphate isomerase/epimerase